MNLGKSREIEVNIAPKTIEDLVVAHLYAMGVIHDNEDVGHIKIDGLSRHPTQFIKLRADAVQDREVGVIIHNAKVAKKS